MHYNENNVIQYYFKDMNIKDPIHVQVLVGSIDMYSRVSPWHIG